MNAPTLSTVPICPTLGMSEGAGLAMLWTCAILLLIGLIAIAGIPGREAKRRGSPSADAINLCGYLGIVFFPLWIVALIWSHAGKPSTAAAGPGRFTVKGVDKSSGMDTSLVVDADTDANARVKAELRGVVVTEVARVA